MMAISISSSWSCWPIWHGQATYARRYLDASL
jgi:hypothetical protein